MDRVGTRLGTTYSVLFYSAVFDLDASGQRPLQLHGLSTHARIWRVGETGQPQTKAVSEWFPAKDRALATAFLVFDSGSSIGGALSPFLVLWIYFHWGMASGVCRARHSWTHLVACVA